MEDLVERCRAATGKAAADLVDEATAALGVLVFGELPDLEGVRRSPRTRACEYARAAPRVRARHAPGLPRGLAPPL